MNKAICRKSDEYFTKGKIYNCSKAYAKFETAVVEAVGDNGESATVDINDPDFEFIFNNDHEEDENIRIKTINECLGLYADCFGQNYQNQKYYKRLQELKEYEENKDGFKKKLERFNSK